MSTFVIEARKIYNAFGNQVVHEGLSVNIEKGEIFAMVGGSGCGKSVLLKSLVGLKKIDKGHIDVLGYNVQNLTPRESHTFHRKIGFLFQEGALISQLTVLQNIAFPLWYLAKIPLEAAYEIAFFKLQLVGLPASAASKVPADISGGMKKRVGLARAIALDPEILFLDEPTAGLDPEASERFDSLIKELKEELDLTVVMVTHDLSTIFNIATRIGIIAHHSLITGTLEQLLKSTDPVVQHYFHSKRAAEIFP